MEIFSLLRLSHFFCASAYRCPTSCYEMIATENSANKFAFIFCGVRVFSPTGELRPHIFMWKLCQFFLWSPAVGSSRELVGSSSFHPPLYENTTSFSVTFWMDGNEPKVFLKETTFMCVCGKVSCPKESATTTSFQIPPAFSSFHFCHRLRSDNSQVLSPKRPQSTMVEFAYSIFLEMYWKMTHCWP